MKTFYLALILGISLTLSGCGSSSDSSNGFVNGGSNTTVEDREELPLFTLEELAKFDGKNGNKAYVAVDGLVYDVSMLTQWANGVHQGNIAGTDLSTAIERAPHGRSVLSRARVVGRLD